MNRINSCHNPNDEEVSFERYVCSFVNKPSPVTLTFHGRLNGKAATSERLFTSDSGG